MQEPREEQASGVATAEREAPRARVLLVEDHEATRDSVARLLACDYDVTAAESGEQALELAAELGPFAVVVTDHGLPGMDGIELLGRLRDCWPDTVRMLLTGLEDLELAVRAMNDGDAYRFLRKPFDTERLRATLAECAQRADAIAQERRLVEQLHFTRETLVSFTELLEGRVEEQMGILDQLHELALRLNDADSLEEIAQRAVGTASRVLGGRGVRLVLEGGHLQGRALDIETGAALEGELHEEPVRTPEGEIGRFVVPLLCPRGRRMSRTDGQVLASVASSTAVAAHNEIRRRERDGAQHATIFALARLAENRDNETGKHLERVCAYCRLVAEGLREDGHHVDEITDQFIEDLVRSAPLHDIGKVGIPDNILLKPGKLTDDEWVVMKEHTTIGADTLRAIVEEGEQHKSSFLLMGLDIAWCHHEKWNGAGYPRGLAGAEIPLSARILSLADCYDALTTRRPYKEPWPHVEAVEFIASRAELDYDPDVVAAFVSRASRADEIRVELADDPEDE